MNPKGPAYWRRQVRRGRIPADDPRATPEPGAAEQLAARLAALPRAAAPLRRR